MDIVHVITKRLQQLYVDVGQSGNSICILHTGGKVTLIEFCNTQVLVSNQTSIAEELMTTTASVIHALDLASPNAIEELEKIIKEFADE